MMLQKPALYTEGCMVDLNEQRNIAIGKGEKHAAKGSWTDERKAQRGFCKQYDFTTKTPKES